MLQNDRDITCGDPIPQGYIHCNIDGIKYSWLIVSLNSNNYNLGFGLFEKSGFYPKIDTVDLKHVARQFGTKLFFDKNFQGAHSLSFYEHASILDQRGLNPYGWSEEEISCYKLAENFGTEPKVYNFDMVTPCFVPFSLY